MMQVRPRTQDAGVSYPADVLATLSRGEGLRAQDQAVPDETPLLTRTQARPVFGPHRQPVPQCRFRVGFLVHLRGGARIG